ncbi:hypothetical protein [Cetobacterium ceti]
MDNKIFTVCPNCTYEFSKKQKIAITFVGGKMVIKCPLCKRYFKYKEFGKNEIIEDIEKLKDRKKGLKYKASEDKKKANFKLLDKLLYSNYKLTNKELMERLEISETEFYRTYGEKVKEIRSKYMQQSLF